MADLFDEVSGNEGAATRPLADRMRPKSLSDVVGQDGVLGAEGPLGAMLADDRLIDPVLNAGGFQHGYTYAGNPLACAAGLAVTREILEHDLMGQAASLGKLLKSELEVLMDEYPFIGDVRGKGLLLAFEIVENRETMQPFPASLNVYARLVELAYERGLIIYSRRTRDGLEGDHFMVCPPMIATHDHVDEIMQTLRDSLDALRLELSLVGRSP